MPTFEEYQQLKEQEMKASQDQQAFDAYQKVKLLEKAKNPVYGSVEYIPEGGIKPEPTIITGLNEGLYSALSFGIGPNPWSEMTSEPKSSLGRVLHTASTTVGENLAYSLGVGVVAKAATPAVRLAGGLLNPARTLEPSIRKQSGYALADMFAENLSTKTALAGDVVSGAVGGFTKGMAKESGANPFVEFAAEMGGSLSPTVSYFLGKKAWQIVSRMRPSVKAENLKGALGVFLSEQENITKRSGRNIWEEAQLLNNELGGDIPTSGVYDTPGMYELEKAVRRQLPAEKTAEFDRLTDRYAQRIVDYLEANSPKDIPIAGLVKPIEHKYTSTLRLLDTQLTKAETAFQDLIKLGDTPNAQKVISEKLTQLEAEAHEGASALFEGLDPSNKTRIDPSRVEEFFQQFRSGFYNNQTDTPIPTPKRHWPNEIMNYWETQVLPTYYDRITANDKTVWLPKEGYEDGLPYKVFQEARSLALSLQRQARFKGDGRKAEILGDFADLIVDDKGGTGILDNAMNFSEEYQLARKGWAQFKKTYHTGVAGLLMRGGKDGALYNKPRSNILQQFIMPDSRAGALEAAQEFKGLFGPTGEISVTSFMVDNAIKASNSADPIAALGKLREKYATVLTEFPGTAKVLDTLTTLKQRIATATTNKDELISQYDNEFFKALFGDYPETAVGNLMKISDPQKRLDQFKLMDQSLGGPYKNINARQSFRRGLWEWVVKEGGYGDLFNLTLRGGNFADIILQKPDALISILNNREMEPIFHAAFGGKPAWDAHVKTLTIATDAITRRLPVQTSIIGPLNLLGSKESQKETTSTLRWIAHRVYAKARGWLSPTWLGIDVATTLVQSYVNKLEYPEVRTVWMEALTNPEFARSLSERAYSPIEARRQFTTMKHRLTQLGFRTLVNENQEEQNVQGP